MLLIFGYRRVLQQPQPAADFRVQANSRAAATAHRPTAADRSGNRWGTMPRPGRGGPGGVSGLVRQETALPTNYESRKGLKKIAVAEAPSIKVPCGTTS